MRSHTVIDTGTVAPGLRVDYWQDSISRVHFPFHARSDCGLSFRAELRELDLGSVRVGRMLSSPLTATRTARLIRSADPELLELNLVLTGGAVHTQHGATLHVGAHEFFLRDSSHPYVTARTGCPSSAASGAPAMTTESIVVRFPRTELPVRWAGRPPAAPLSGRDSVGALLADLLVSVVRHGGALPAAQDASIAGVVLDLVAALCSPEPSALPPASRQQALLAAIHRHIDRNLADPALTPQRIAEVHGISVRYLHRLFQLDGDAGVAATIRRRRLDRCRRDLVDPRYAELPVQTVAARWGLTDPAHFSRLFSRAYGVPPSVYRDAAS